MGGRSEIGGSFGLHQGGAGEIRLIEPHAGRRETAQQAGIALTRAPADESGESLCDLVVDAVGSAASRTQASRLVRPGGVIVHAGLLPGHDGLDIRRLTLHEITFTGTYCYTPAEFATVVALLVQGRFGPLTWLVRRPLAEGAQAIADLAAGRFAAAKLTLIP